MFYTFNQNNSGGSFVFDESAGLTHFVIIEAKTADQASAIAQDIGIYFDGVRKGRDCGCCGDRWYETSESNKRPDVYGKHPSKFKFDFQWMDDGKEVCVHYLDGRKEWFGGNKNAKAA